MQLTLLIILSILLLVFGAVTFKSDIHSKTNRSFLGLVLFTVLWIFSNYLSNNLKDYSIVLIANKTIFLSTSIVVWYIHQLSIYYPHRDKKVAIWKFYLGWISTVLIVLLSISPFIVKDTHIYEDHSDIEFGWAAYLYLAHLSINFVCFAINIYKKLRDSSGLEKMKVQYLFVGLLLSTIGASITNLILPMFFNFFEASNIGPFFLIIFVAFLSYSILKHRLFGIRYIITKLILYSVNIVLPILFFYLALLLLNALWGSVYSFVAIVTGVLISIIFYHTSSTINRYLKSVLEKKYLYRGVNPIEVKEEYTKKISTELSIEKIAIETINVYDAIFDIERTGIIILETTSRSVIFKKFKNFGENPLQMRDLLEVINYWGSVEHSPIIIKEELEYLLHKSPDPRLERVLQFMHTNKVSAILPLNRKVHLNGIILLGSKQSSVAYTQEDLEYLESLTVNASVAFSRSILYNQVQDFNNVLKQKVNEQTQELQVKIKELEEARRKEADMIDIMGHELRTPATIVKLNADLLDKFAEKVEQDKETFVKYVTRIKDAVENEIKLINTLLSSAKLEGDKIEINPEEVNIYQEIDMALHGEEHNAKDKNLEINNLVPKEIPSVFADRARTVEILNNLINNAVKYTEAGTITVNANEEGDFVKVTVADSGRGISQEDIQRLGTKFFRTKTYIQSDMSDDVDIVRPGGTGLGLYVTFNLIRKMGGDINVQSELGKGSIFTFTLPKYNHQDNATHTKTSNDMFERLGLK